MGGREVIAKVLQQALDSKYQALFNKFMLLHVESGLRHERSRAQELAAVCLILTKVLDCSETSTT